MIRYRLGTNIPSTIFRRVCALCSCHHTRVIELDYDSELFYYISMIDLNSHGLDRLVRIIRLMDEYTTKKLLFVRKTNFFLQPPVTAKSYLPLRQPYVLVEDLTVFLFLWRGTKQRASHASV